MRKEENQACLVFWKAMDFFLRKEWVTVLNAIVRFREISSEKWSLNLAMKGLFVAFIRNLSVVYEGKLEVGSKSLIGVDLEIEMEAGRVPPQGFSL